jgi:hypothetical protein
MFPHLTLFMEIDNVFARRRQLDEIACTVARVDGNVEHAGAERLPA